MRLGDYLVQRKVLSAHQILKALAEQRRRRKFLPLLLVELGALEDHRALSFCSQADEQGEDFLDVLLQEKFISQEQCHLIRETWMRSGPPLGRLLVELGFMDEATRQELLDEFEAEKSLEENLAALL